MQRKLLITGSIFVFTAIILGAFGRHYFEEKLGADGVSGFDTAVKYQVWHGIILLVFATLAERLQKALKVMFWGVLIGVILFSGSIYVLVALKTVPVDPIPLPVVLTTPLGGSILILSWAYLIIQLIRNK